MPENKTIPKPEAPPKASVPQAPAAAPKPPESKNKPAAEPKTPKELPKEAAPTPKPEAPTEPKKPEVKPPAIGPKPKAADEKVAKEAAPAEPKKEEATPSTAEVKGNPAAAPKKPDVVPLAADTKGKSADLPKAEDVKSPITISGKGSVEIPIDPKPISEPEAAALAQEAEGPKGITITQVFADRLAPPLEADLRSLPIPKEGEAFSMRLHPAYFFEFLEHPFSINRETKDYKDLLESIKENGIRDPVYCRPREKGGLEIISGHRRHDIGTQLNYPIPTIIVQADDDTARIAVVDGNLHRMDIPTSELARAAKMKMEALTRKAGRRSKMEQLTAPQKRSDQQVADDMGMSRNQVQRLVRIDSLVPELKQQVDDKTLPFNTAVELSYMKPDEQKKVVDFMEKEQITPSMAQATQLKEASKHAETLAKHIPSLAPANAVDEKKIASIIKPKKEPDLKVVLTAEELRSYFPDKLPTVSEAKRAIFDALDMRQKALDKQAKKQDIKAPAR